MTLRAAIAGLRLTRLPALPTPAVELLAKELAAQEGEAPRPGVDLDEIARRFIAAAERHETVPSRQWRSVPWCLWATTPAIAGNEAALQMLLDRVAASGSRRPFRSLANAYLTQFGPRQPALARVAAVLAAHAADAHDKWAQAHERYGIFDSARAAETLASAALNLRDNPVQLLRSLDLGEMIAVGGLAKETLRQGLRMIAAAPALSVAARLEVIQSFSVGADEAVILSEAKADVARAAILPFRDQNLATSERDLLLEFILKLFKDPRTHPADWIGMDEVAEIVRGWLTELSLRQFFDVVDEVALPHQWQYRRAFWTAVFEAGLIRNAWVVFDPAGAAVATRAFRDKVGFGRFIGGAVQPGHSVLIMRIGNGVVADWSHNSRCNVWESATEPDAPRLNAPSYRRSELRKPIPNTMSESQANSIGAYSHSSPERGLWQGRVAQHLRKMTGVLVSPDSYRVP